MPVEFLGIAATNDGSEITARSGASFDKEYTLRLARVELIIGKGNGPEQAELFGIGRLEAWDTIAENYRLLRQLWSGHKVTWSPPGGVASIRKTPLTGAEVFPPVAPALRQAIPGPDWPDPVADVRCRHALLCR